jgi:hypothetical protein
MARAEQMLPERKTMLVEADKEVNEENGRRLELRGPRSQDCSPAWKALAVDNDPNIPDGSLMQPWMIRKSTRAVNAFTPSRSCPAQHKCRIAAQHHDGQGHLGVLMCPMSWSSAFQSRR